MATGNQGFASMDEKKHKTIASKGGKSDGGNFKQSTTRAAAAGKKGGAVKTKSSKMTHRTTHH